ncbi:MAG: glutaredoxin family protein [Bacteroidetes bacterium]|nr:glutaredoxin family protein [Bacteroidota bacterium]
MQVRLYTTAWRPDCHRVKWFLRQPGIAFEKIDIDQNPEAEALVMQHNEGRRRVPTIAFDGRLYGNPPLPVLARLLEECRA